MAQLITLDSLSAKYESNGKSSTISTGIGDHGGKSYGRYQMTFGTVTSFLNNLPPAIRLDLFGNARPQDPEFDEIWRNAVKRTPTQFAQLEYDFIKATHYQPMYEKLAAIVSLILYECLKSQALNCVLWSTAVQHGVNSQIPYLTRPQTQKDNPVEFWIRGIYAERGAKYADGTMVHFKSSSPQMQAGVAKRYENELKDALAMLKGEQK